VRFSIALATFNGARFLADQLESFRAQHLLPSELVVCDDGSTDGTLELLHQFALNAPFPVRVERNERRLGVSDNFFRAASLCQYDWILYSDQDDVWLPEKLLGISQAGSRHPSALLVAHQAIVVDDRLNQTGDRLNVPSVSRPTLVRARSLRVWHPPLGFTIGFDARLVRDFPVHSRPITPHDRWTFVLATSVGDVLFLPQPLALYRRHASNLTQFTPTVPLVRSLRQPGNAGAFLEEGEVIRQVSEYFDRCQQAAGPWRGAVEQARYLYSRQAAMLLTRAQLCRSGSGLLRRASTYVRMLLIGAYGRNSRGGLGWRAGVKDLVRVLLAP